MKQEDKGAIEAFATEIVDLMKEEVFEIEGAPTVVVKYSSTSEKPGSQFRKKPVFGGWEFMLSYAYVGARNRPVFGFTPVDKQDWEFMELEIKDIDTILPLAGPALAKHFGIDTTERFEEVFAIAFEIRKARREKEAQLTYKDNPMFGMF